MGLVKDIWYGLKHLKQKDKNICPRCGNIPFSHGYTPFEDYYCTKCHLWEPDWEKRNKMIKEAMG